MPPASPRPHDIDLFAEPVPEALAAVVQDIRPLGPFVRIELRHGSETVEVEVPREKWVPGQVVVGGNIWFRPRNLRLFVQPGGEAPQYAI